jgi:ATP-dependent RNA helicase SUPV3L1/SUV3
MRHLVPQAKRITFHSGPTNSGKTFAAIELLRHARTGCYAAPLRLLAHEVYTQLTGSGVRTSLLTGQLQIIDPQATHVACTAEMAPIKTVFDVGVVDEIQLMGSPDRGFAFTNALYALQCSHLVLCGAPHSGKLLSRLITPHQTLHEQTFERRSALTVEKMPLSSLKRLRVGDCVVAFNKKTLYEMRRNIARPTALIYGGLPPEQVRIARHFGEQLLDNTCSRKPRKQNPSTIKTRIFYLQQMLLVWGSI